MALLKDRYGFEPSPEVRTFTPDLGGLIGWLETQDGATEYDWACVGDCLLNRFARASDQPDGRYVPWFGGHEETLPFQTLAMHRPWTYAAALTRARALRDRVSE